MPDGAVIPASGRRARHHAACPERRSRSCEVADTRCTKDTRGRSPPSSPRTTSRDVIELQPSPTLLGWLRYASACLGSPVSPEVPPGWSSPAQLQQRSGSVPPCPSTPLHIPADVFSPEEDQAVARPRPTQLDSTPLFVPRPQALLSTPNSTPPRPPATRRKTLAGATGLNLIRRSPRLPAKNKDMPIAMLAERLLCQRMGVIEGGLFTEAAIAKYVALFRS